MIMTVGDEDDDLFVDSILEDSEETSLADGSSSEAQTVLPRRKVASIRGESVENIYKNVVDGVKETLEENDVVDIELTFKASTIRGGIPIISRNKESNVVEIRLATRISGSGKHSVVDR